jgi:hypothetical protein
LRVAGHQHEAEHRLPLRRRGDLTIQKSVNRPSTVSGFEAAFARIAV